MPARLPILLIGLAAATCSLISSASRAQVRSLSADQATYVDTVELSKKADLVVLARITQLKPVAGTAPGTGLPNHRRYYAEASTRALLYGKNGIGGSLQYLVDLPEASAQSATDWMGKDVFLFASRVPGRPKEIKLVEPAAQQLWSPERESRLRGVLRALVSPRAPAPVTGVRELGYVPGNLAGQGRTQIFLDTKKGPVTIAVRHMPGQPENWGVSFSELTGGDLHPPTKDTLEWYNLACFLPASPPQSAYVSGAFPSKQQAYADYRMVLAALGPCERSQ
ncbi:MULTISPECIES: hypothetical protein [unclassified Novosphingobium]|uniref:hypothetical protein n=1 Tax=unclassified Novosphingobium TaxID=2644732 RepID=UPI0006C89997|nr:MULTISPECIES: hypothetical protein [unclassified Novosphingobium]KPH66161.1 hypothetical protein ADT71_07930 [Novosphingobium sp. ST904]MPS67933.1 hypothetical protein [Novosphingobium sp.]TCM27156.1 hypothetical protein EDF59_13213 [Novosphingobium sp. ST904]